MSKIKKVIGREIIDSRGNPTVEAEIFLENGLSSIASVPSGASTGSREAIELRDGDISKFQGNGVTKAVKLINKKISNAIHGVDIENQLKIDQIMIELDNTENKSNLGANTILSVSLAAAKTAAKNKKIKLYEYIAELYGSPKKFTIPMPMMNIINGGIHADNNIDIQEFMIQPISAKNIKEAIRMCSEIFQNLKKILKKNKMNTSVGDEGGYAPNLSSNNEALDLIIESVKISGYKMVQDIVIAIDCAASEFYKNKNYTLIGEKKTFNSKEFSHYLADLVKKYPIFSIEDGLDESDNIGFLYLTKLLGKKIQLVGDDLFVTNSKILKKGIKQGIANAILIKYNQIGTLSETLDTIKLAKKFNYNTIISHRSGETEDVTIADLAVGTSAGQIKTGSISRSERVAKYNQLIRIEEEIIKKSHFISFFNLNNKLKYY